MVYDYIGKPEKLLKHKNNFCKQLKLKKGTRDARTKIMCLASIHCDSYHHN